MAQGRLEILREYTWPVVEWAIATLAIRLEVIAGRNGLALENWNEDGLGPCSGCAFRLQSGVVVLIQELEHAILRLNGKGPDVYADAGDVERYGVDHILSDTLEALGLGSSDVDARYPPPPEGEVARVRRAVEEIRRARAEKEMNRPK